MNKYIIRHIASLLIIATLYTGSTIPTNLQTEPIKLARAGFHGGRFGRGGFDRGGFRHQGGFRQQRHRRPVNGRRDHRRPWNNRRYYGGNVYGVAIDGDDDYWPYAAAIGTTAAYTASQQQQENLQQENESLRQHVSDLQSKIEELQQARESEDDD